jgi:hypothetical protein
MCIFNFQISFQLKNVETENSLCPYCFSIVALD